MPNYNDVLVVVRSFILISNKLNNLMTSFRFYFSITDMEKRSNTACHKASQNFVVLHFMHDPQIEHMAALYHIFRYVRGILILVSNCTCT